MTKSLLHLLSKLILFEAVASLENLRPFWIQKVEHFADELASSSCAGSHQLKTQLSRCKQKSYCDRFIKGLGAKFQKLTVSVAQNT
jgi:hypothetical protein